MDDIVKPYSWRVAILAVLPNVIWVIARLVIAASPALWANSWAAEAVALALSLVVIGAALFRKRSLTLWSLPALGMAFLAAFSLSGTLLSIGAPRPETMQYTAGRILLGAAVGVVAAGVIGSSVWAARRWGGAAALLTSGLIGWFAFGVIDPTYGLMIVSPERFSPLGVALLDAIPLVLLHVMLPVMVLRAPSGRSQIARLLGGFALFLTSMVLISLLHAFEVQGVLGARPLIVELGYTLALGPLVGGVFWVIMAGLTVVCKFLERGDSGAHPGEAVAAA